MMLLLGDDALAARAAVARNELAPLATSLAAELRGLEERELYVPEEKALLSRTGGRCERDGSTLEFDPCSPHRHRCPVCGTVHAGELHDRFWVFWYQLWLAERAVHGALLGRLRGDANAAALATRILERYTDEYLLYPNRDNVLGPTRVFFSTYLEAIWLVNLCIALDLLSPTTGALGERVRDRIIEPSAALIASYDEGASNRQVWNDAALLAAARLLGRENDVVHAVFGRSGVLHHLEHGLLADGTWYEGENYHLFAHRGLWYGLTMAQHAGLEFPPSAVERFQEGFATPFLTALPDMTLPSRRDSPYAISLRQPRFAELCELGLAREAGDGDPRLRSMLHRLYDDPYPRREIGRANSTADVERNLPGSALSRADLGWRSLLFARPVLPPLAPAPLGSVLLEAQGIAVFRRERERVYIALDYGASGGGHGHPDRLNVLLSDDGTRWLDDMGTGSYVDPSLHWYRSTLAHNAPRFDDRDQERVDGELLAFQESGEIGWISAEARGLSPGVRATRTIVAMPDYVVDELRWTSANAVVMDLPIHVDPAAVSVHRDSRGQARGDSASADTMLPDALGVLHDVTAQSLGARTVARIYARDGARVLNGFVIASGSAVLYRATGPGAPGSRPRPFLVLRVPSDGAPQWVRAIWSWTDCVANVWTEIQGLAFTVERNGGEHDVHTPTVDGWRVSRLGESGAEVVSLAGVRWRDRTEAASGSPAAGRRHGLRPGRPLRFQLGEPQYRRSEETWRQAGSPTAAVTVLLEPNEMIVEVSVHKTSALTFAAEDATNPYDNEPPDINGDGVQLYLSDERGCSAWVFVPERSSKEGRERQSEDDGEGEGDGQAGTGGAVRARMVAGWTIPREWHATWRRTGDGWAIRVQLPWPATDSSTRSFALGLVVNEKPAGRARRRGQLVLGGTEGEFVYLRGDREDRERLPQFQILT